MERCIICDDRVRRSPRERFHQPLTRSIIRVMKAVYLRSKLPGYNGGMSVSSLNEHLIAGCLWTSREERDIASTDMPDLVKRCYEFLSGV